MTTAVMHTSAGDITIELFPNHAPKTVENFVGLATGTKEWKDYVTHEKTTKPLYDGTIFHRVIADFMIQGGDPEGTGMGGPGYVFADEFHGELQFDRPFLFAMAVRSEMISARAATDFALVSFAWRVRTLMDFKDGRCSFLEVPRNS